MVADSIEGRVDRMVRASRRYRTDSDRPIPESVIELLTNSKRLYRTWWFAHYFIGLTGVVAGTLLTAITSSRGEHLAFVSVDLTQYSWLIGIVAAVSTSLVTFLGPLHKAERYWSAYHVLERACLEYSYHEPRNARWDRLMQKVAQVHGILQVADIERKFGEDASFPRCEESAANQEPVAPKDR